MGRTDVVQEANSIQSMFIHASGLLASIKRKQMNRTSGGPNASGLEDLEDALLRGPEKIQEWCDRYSRINGPDKFAKGDSSALKQFQELSKKMQRDLLFPLQRASKLGGDQNYHALKTIADDIQDGYLTEIMKLGARLQNPKRPNDTPAVPEKGRSGLFNFGVRSQKQGATQNTESARMISSPELASEFHAPPRHHANLYHEPACILTTETIPANARYLDSLPSSAEPVREMYASRPLPEHNRGFNHAYAAKPTPANGQHLALTSPSPDPAFGISAPGQSPEASRDYFQTYAAKPASVNGRHPGAMPSSSEIYLPQMHGVRKRSNSVRTPSNVTLAPGSPEVFSPHLGAPAFAVKASASREYLGENTNPFSQGSLREEKTAQSTARKPSADSIEQDMVPPPLRTTRVNRSAPREHQRMSYSSSAMSSDVDSPATPASAGFSARDLPVRIIPTVDGMRFPPPPSRTGSQSDAEAPAVPQGLPKSLEGSVVTRSEQMSKPPRLQAPPGVQLASIRSKGLGMPAPSNYSHLMGSIPKTLKINSSSASVPGPWGLDPSGSKGTQRTMPLSEAAGTKIAVNICKGALNAQNGYLEKKKTWDIERRPCGVFGPAIQAYVKCKYCHFEGKYVDPRKKVKSKQDYIDKKVYGSNGVLYRWLFLYLSHVKLEKQVDHPVDSAFGCVFCCAAGHDTPIFLGVASFLQHLQFHRQVEPLQKIAKMMGAVVDRSPAIEENFNVALPPLVI